MPAERQRKQRRVCTDEECQGRPDPDDLLGRCGMHIIIDQVIDEWQAARPAVLDALYEAPAYGEES